MLTVLILASVPVITTPKPLPPQPKQPIELFNKEGLITKECEEQEKEKKKKGAKDNHQKFFTAYTTKRTKVNIAQSRKPMDVRNKEGLVAEDRAKRRMKEKMSKMNNKSSLHLS